MPAFPAQLLEALHPHLATEPFPGNSHSPFSLLRLSGTEVVIHCIDLPTYGIFCRQPNAALFFRQLSEQFSADGYLLIHLWEDVWRQKPAVVLSRLRALAGQSQRIPARLTGVRRIDRPTAERFLNDHHLQVFTNARFKYGLFLPERYFRILAPEFRQQQVPPGATELLVSVATFSHPRRIERDGDPYRSTELVRFAHHRGSTVVGGLDKLLRAFTKEQRPDDLMTYADRDWSDGRSYAKLGFERFLTTEPQRFWLHPDEGVRYYPHRLPEGLTEEELPAAGYIPIYNSGSIKFVKRLQ